MRKKFFEEYRYRYSQGSKHFCFYYFIFFLLVFLETFYYRNFAEMIINYLRSLMLEK